MKYNDRNKMSNTNFEFPTIIYPKIFGSTFFWFIASLYFGVISIETLSQRGLLYSIEHDWQLDILSSLLILWLIYNGISWCCIVMKISRLELTGNDIIYRTAFKKKVIRTKDIIWVDFEHTDYRITRAKTEGILFKCDNDTDKIKSNDLYLSYYLFPKQKLLVAINSLFKFEKQKYTKIKLPNHNKRIW